MNYNQQNNDYFKEFEEKQKELEIRQQELLKKCTTEIKNTCDLCEISEITNQAMLFYSIKLHKYAMAKNKHQTTENLFTSKDKKKVALYIKSIKKYAKKQKIKLKNITVNYLGYDNLKNAFRHFEYDKYDENYNLFHEIYEYFKNHIYNQGKTTPN